MTQKCIEAPAIKTGLPIAIGIDTIFTVKSCFKLIFWGSENHSITFRYVNAGGWVFFGLLNTSIFIKLSMTKKSIEAPCPNEERMGKAPTISMDNSPFWAKRKRTYVNSCALKWFNKIFNVGKLLSKPVVRWALVIGWLKLMSRPMNFSHRMTLKVRWALVIGWLRKFSYIC